MEFEGMKNYIDTSEEIWHLVICLQKLILLIDLEYWVLIFVISSSVASGSVIEPKLASSFPSQTLFSIHQIDSNT